MKHFLQVILSGILCVAFFGCATAKKEKLMRGFLNQYHTVLKPMDIEEGLTSWQAETTGKDEAFAKLSKIELEIKKIHSNQKAFAFLKELKESGHVENSLLARQLDVLYLMYLKNQVDPDLLKQTVELGNEIAKKFNVFRGAMDGKKVTVNEIRQILKTQTDSNKRKAAWLASKQVGEEVAADIIRLVKLRNQAAEKLGFENFHTMSLTLSEQDPAELESIFDQLAEWTEEPFRAIKADLDRVLSGMYAVPAAELKPWHYHDPFFQETPMVYEVDLDVYYKGKNIKELGERFYAGIGLPVTSILERSDLYEREGKSPHAFCIDIDREGDIRILCNLKSTENWMEVMLHELGHGVYDLYQNPAAPYLLRRPAHIFTTEGIAMFFGRLSRNPAWMQQMLDLTDEQRQEIEKVSDKYARLKQLIFARWAMVMYNFEKGLYADPDQDLNALWWEQVEKFQFVKKPEGRDEPDWASKIHIASAPCYYHNYLMGELFASQLHHHIVAEVLQADTDRGVSYCDDEKVGEFLKQNVFERGAMHRWETMIILATGDPLTPKYFVEQFVR